MSNLNEYLQDDGRFHCPDCKWSTQLANKFERHLEKKHGGGIEPDAVRETFAAVVVDDAPAEEE